MFFASIFIISFITAPFVAVQGNGFIPFEQFERIAQLFSTPTAPTTPPPNVESEGLGENCRRFHRAMSSAFSKFIWNSYQMCSATLRFERERFRNCTTNAGAAIPSEEAIVELYEGRLTNGTRAEQLLQEQNEINRRNRQPTRRISQNEKQEVCTRTTNVNIIVNRNTISIAIYYFIRNLKKSLKIVVVIDEGNKS